jgi:hypothetical protein
MSESIPIRIHHEGDSRRRTIRFPEDFSEDLLVEEVGPDRFLLAETSIFGPARYHDVICATALEDGSLLFQSVVERSSFVSGTYLLSEKVCDSVEMKEILSDVLKLGGCWERAFGGLLIINLPPTEFEGIELRIKSLIG